MLRAGDLRAAPLLSVDWTVTTPPAVQNSAATWRFYQTKISELYTRIADLKQEAQQVRADLTQQIENLQAEKRTLMSAVLKPPPVPLVPIDLRSITEHFSPTEFPDRPHRTVVTIQTNRRIQPTRIRVVFDGPISLKPTHRMLQGVTSWELVGATAFTHPEGVVVNENAFEVGFSSPAFTPQGPLILTVLSKERVNIIRVER